MFDGRQVDLPWLVVNLKEMHTRDERRHLYLSFQVEEVGCGNREGHSRSDFV